MEEFVDDFFEDNEDTVDALYTNAAGAAKHIRVIFDRENSTITMGAVDVQSALPTARCRTKDVQDADNGATLVIEEVTYHVKETHVDATGVTLLALSRDLTV